MNHPQYVQGPWTHQWLQNHVNHDDLNLVLEGETQVIVAVEGGETPAVLENGTKVKLETLDEETTELDILEEEEALETEEMPLEEE